MDVNRKLLNVLLDLHGKNRSGILRIQRNSTKKQLVLQNGELVFAESNAPKEHLAHVMVGMNLLPRVKLTEVASLMKAGKTSDEAILALPDASLETLEKGRREQAIMIVSSLLGWDNCDLRLYPESESIRGRISLRMQLPELIVSSIRRAISKRLLSSPPHFFDETLVITGEREFPLNDLETEAYSLLQSGKRASEVLASIPHDANADKTLLCLYHLGLIRCIEQQEAGITESAESDPLALKLDDLLVRFESANLYEVLCVSTDASQEEIQAGYHEQAKQLHPDRFQTNEFSDGTRIKAEKVFAKINEAYHTLKSPESRTEYDSLRPQKRPIGSGPKTGAAQSAETAEGLFREGRVLLSRGDVETAVERFRGCIWLCPEIAIYHYHLGVAESCIPKFRKSAEQHLLRAIELQDMSADCHLALAKLYMDVKLPGKAEQQLEQALLWDPQNSEALRLARDLKAL